jgi:Transposase DDE domain
VATSDSSEPQVPPPTRRIIRAIDTALQLFDEHVRLPQPHGNEKLHLRGMVGGLLAAAFQPAAWALRPLDDLSLHPRVQALTGVDRMARSTICDAMARFDPRALDPVIRAIERQLPQLERFDPAAAQVTRKIIAADGSWFNLAGQVTHALQCRRGNKGRQCRVRLNLQIDVDAFCPTDFDVSGKGDGSEAAAFMRSIQPQCIYLVDRNFVSHAFINAVLAKDSNLVLRLKKGVNFEVRTVRELSGEDRTHHVLRDEVGILPGPKSKGNADARSCSDAPPRRAMRRVTVWDEKNKREVVLLSDLLDVDAYVIAVLYRLRWQIELFLRWLKVLAGFEHLLNQSERGITLQFYIAVLMALLIHLQTGTRVSKYSLLWVSWLADGHATPEAMAQAMARHERERENARRRRLAKKQAR